MGNSEQGIGYKTPAKEIQDEFIKAQKELSKAKTDWQALNRTLVSQYTKFLDDIEPKIKSGLISDGEFTVLL